MGDRNLPASFFDQNHNSMSSAAGRHFSEFYNDPLSVTGALHHLATAAATADWHYPASMQQSVYGGTAAAAAASSTSTATATSASAASSRSPPASANSSSSHHQYNYSRSLQVSLVFIAKGYQTSTRVNLRGAALRAIIGPKRPVDWPIIPPHRRRSNPSGPITTINKRRTPPQQPHCLITAIITGPPQPPLLTITPI